MKLNGGVTAVLLATVLSSTIGWGTYITRRQAEQAVKLAVIEQKLDALSVLLGHLHRRSPRSTLDPAINP